MANELSNITSSLGTFEPTDVAQYTHAFDTYFIWVGTLVRVIDTEGINIGETIVENTNVVETNIADALSKLNSSIDTLDTDVDAMKPEVARSVKHTLNTQVGSKYQPIYVSANGEASASDLTLGQDGLRLLHIENGEFTVSTKSSGSPTKPIYLNTGRIEESNGDVSALSPSLMCMQQGQLITPNFSLGGPRKPIYLAGGGFFEFDETLGSATKPVFLSNGTFVACSYKIPKINKQTCTTSGEWIMDADFETTSPSAGYTVPADGKNHRFDTRIAIQNPYEVVHHVTGIRAIWPYHTGDLQVTAFDIDDETKDGLTIITCTIRLKNLGNSGVYVKNVPPDSLKDLPEDVVALKMEFEIIDVTTALVP